MIKRVVASVIALFAMGAAAAVTVVAAAYALFALLRDPLTPAGASAVVALVFAVIAAVVGLILGAKARGPSGRSRRGADISPMDRIGQIARERPVLAAVGALAAGVIALKNPQAVASIVTAIFAARAADRSDRRR